MNKKEIKSSYDLKNINLESLVQEAKDQVIVENECKSEVVEEETAAQPIGNFSEQEKLSFSQSWNSFLSFLLKYKNNKKKERFRSFYIENEIIDVLENCSIEKSKTTDIINGILRSFIEEHKAQFRDALKPRPTLISLDE